MQCHRHSLAAGRGNNSYLASGKVCVFKVFLSVNFDLQTAIWWSCLGECSCSNSFIECIMKRMFTWKHARRKNNNAASLSSAIPWGECTLGISALPNSFPKCNQVSQSSNVIFTCPLRSWLSPSLKFFSLLVIKTFHLGWDMALKCSFPHHLRKSAPWGIPCRALLYLYVDERGGEFPEMLDILLDLQKALHGSLLQSPALSTPCLLTFWDTTMAPLSGNHFLLTGTLLNLSRSLSLFILLKYIA